MISQAKQVLRVPVLCWGWRSQIGSVRNDGILKDAIVTYYFAVSNGGRLFVRKDVIPANEIERNEVFVEALSANFSLNLEYWCPLQTDFETTQTWSGNLSGFLIHPSYHWLTLVEDSGLTQESLRIKKMILKFTKKN